MTSAPATLVFDCFSGIAGDMTIAALVDAGAPLESVVAGLHRLLIPEFELATERVTRGGITALHLRVSIASECTYQPDEMRALVREVELPPRVEQRALATVGWLEKGEALAHETNRPHLHEAGGVDAMIDIVGSMLALEALGVEAAFCPVVTAGSGTIARTQHGPIPAAPGPAAAHILREAGFPVRFVEASHEMVTPTGAAILAAVAKPGAATISMTGQGAGAGTFDPPGRPNALRVFLGRAVSPALPRTGLLTRELVEMAANIDDMAPSLLAHARDRLLEEGALDAWTEPIGMKKGRSAVKLCALVPAEDEGRFAELFLRETTTLGVRVTQHRRHEAPRRFETFDSSLGPIRVKVATIGEDERRTLEFEDLKALAAAHGVPLVKLQRLLGAELAAAENRVR